MTVRVNAGSVPRAKLTVIRLGVLAILASAALAGCTPSGSPGSIPAPTGTKSGAASNSAHSTASGGTASGHASSSARASASSRPTRTPISAASPTPNLTGAPGAGGGGTAGLQDTMLFGLGGTAILAGAASIAYRRRLTRYR